MLVAVAPDVLSDFLARLERVFDAEREFLRRAFGCEPTLLDIDPRWVVREVLRVKSEEILQQLACCIFVVQITHVVFIDRFFLSRKEYIGL